MDSGVASMHLLFELHTRLFVNSLTGVGEDLWVKRAESGVNNFVDTSCHLLGARFFLANMLGWEIGCSLAEALQQVKKVDELPELPTLAAVESAWKELSAGMEERFDELTDTLLNQESGQPFPVASKSRSGGALFLLSHEAYHIGQMAYLRRIFGLPAMSYS
jgi:hypothetical protein